MDISRLHLQLQDKDVHMGVCARERERMLRTSYASACILIVERMCRIVKGKRDSKRWCGSQREERVER